MDWDKNPYLNILVLAGFFLTCFTGVYFANRKLPPIEAKLSMKQRITIGCFGPFALLVPLGCIAILAKTISILIPNNFGLAICAGLTLIGFVGFFFFGSGMFQMWRRAANEWLRKTKIEP